MMHFRRFRFLIWCGVYSTLVVAEVTTDKVNTETLPSTAEALNRSNRKRSIPVPTCPDHPNNEPHCKDVCLTPECKDAAVKIWKNMDYDVDPCDDFYKFSCGGYLNSTVIPANQPFVGAFDSLSRKVLDQLRTIIEEEGPPNEPRPHRLAKDFYKACMNATAREKHGLQPLLDNLKELGGWPVLEGYRWNESSFNWVDSIHKFRKRGYSVNYFIKFDVIRYIMTKLNRHHLFLSAPNFGIPRSSLIKGFNNTEVQEYYKYMVDIAVILGADRLSAKLQLRESLEFEIQLAKISTDNELFPDIEMQHEISVDELSTNITNMPMLEYLNTILAPQARLNPNDNITVEWPLYLYDLGVLISKTPKRAQANYAFWRAVDDSADYLTDIVRERKMKLQGKEKGNLKWYKCVPLVSDHLDFSVSSMYYNQEARNTVLEMTSKIKNAFKNILRKVKWMDKKTKKNAIRKLTNLKTYIVQPQENVIIRNLDKLYINLELNANDFLGNMLNVTIFETNYLFNMLNKRVRKDEWWRSLLKPTNFVPFNELTRNGIAIPGGLMQDPFYNNSRPQYMNYGAIGFIIGREFIRGFDETGRYFYRNGHDIEWWKKETITNYGNKTQCLIHQYGSYRNENAKMNLNGKQTLDENVADNGGVKAAYYAYNRWVKRNGVEEKLPGISFTPKQLFWISFANTLCNKYRPEVMRLLMRGRTSPAEYRVNGVLSNTEEFSRDFKCPFNTKMNPPTVNKCVLW